MDPFDQFAPAPLLPGALCAQTGYGDLWFPERGVNPHAAKETCARCPLLTSCLTYALTHPEHGVWGATTEAERDVLTGRRTDGYKANRAQVIARLASLDVDVEHILDTQQEAA